MTIEYKAFKGSKDGIIEASLSREQLGAREVLVEISHTGLCGTDQHFMQQDMVLGHEGVGTIIDVGSQVKIVKKGDRVGLSYFHDCCNNCPYCLSGRDNYCVERHYYGVSERDQGSFASHAIWKDDFVFPIPDGLKSEIAAPLMCAGATVFSAIESANLKPGDTVGIIGVGGLGHLAIQFASKMGYQVIAFSGSDSKKEESTKLGAKSFYAMKDKPSFEPIKDSINLLVNTASDQPDWKTYVPALASQCVIIPLAVSQKPIEMPARAVTTKALRLQGCMLGSRATVKRMLHFAATHDIRPIIEEFPLTKEGINEASQKLADGKMRYRGVLHRL